MLNFSGQIASRFLIKKQFFWAKSIRVAHCLPPELIEVIEALWGHLVDQLTGDDLFEEATDVELGPQVEPGRHADATIADGFQDVKVTDSVTKP